MAQDSDSTTDSSVDDEKQTLEEKVKEHIRKRKAAYVKMGSVDSDPDD